MRFVALVVLAACSLHDQPGDGRLGFAVVEAHALSTFSIAITFSDPPAPAQAAVLASYTFEPALGLAGNSSIVDATVTLGTLQQHGVTYQLAIAGITRLADGAALTAASTTFTGHTPFNVASAVPTSSTSVVLTFDAPPDPVQATTLANYAITDPNALDLSGTPQLAGNSVTLTTSAQSAVDYALDVFDVTRASDHEPLYGTSGSFVGTP